MNLTVPETSFVVQCCLPFDLLARHELDLARGTRGPLGACGTGRTLGARGAVGAVRALSAVGAIGADGASFTFDTFFAVGALGATAHVRFFCILLITAPLTGTCLSTAAPNFALTVFAARASIDSATSIGRETPR